MTYTNDDYVDQIDLPEWMKSVLPEHLPWSVISFADGKFRVSHDGSEFDEIIEAYDYVSFFKNNYQVVLDYSVDGHKGEFVNGFFFCDIEPGEGSSRLLASFTTEDQVAKLKESYFTWLTKISIEYSIDPDDFFKAHNWLTFHPVFWRRMNLNNPFHWITDDGLRDSSVSVWWDEENNKPGICLDAGEHKAPHYTHYSNDRFTFFASTYEEAIIMLAKEVNKFFDVDGVERFS